MRRFKRIYIEITNSCNLDCSFCSGTSRKKEFMDEELFRRILEDVHDMTGEIVLHVLGEPLLHPSLSSFIDLVHGKNLDVMITTNGTLLETASGRMLHEKNIKCINISLHALPETSDGEKILGQIFSFCDSVKKGSPDTLINLRLWNALSEEIKWIIDGINSKFKSSIEQPDRLNSFKKNKSVLLTERISLHFDTRFQWPGLDMPETGNKGFCYGLKSHFGILADGTVIPCCLDSEGIISLGSIRRDSAENIISSSRAQNMIEGFRGGIMTEELCRHCGYARRFTRKIRKTGNEGGNIK